MTQSESTGCKLTSLIGLGSNLSNPTEQIRSARKAIRQMNDVRETAFSSMYQSPPMGPANQPDYINAVMAVETGLPAQDLLSNLQAIETMHGRRRTGERWGARTLDLDLLLYGKQQIAQPDLIVPHVGIGDRAFVIYPLLEIAPDLVIPGLGTVRDLASRLLPDGLIKVETT